MKTVFAIFLLFLLSFSTTIYAQKWEVVASPAKAFSENAHLTFMTNTPQHLSVINLDAESKEMIKQNLFSYETTSLNLNWKENQPFRIYFTMENKNANPYSYKYRVYETTKKGKLKKKWHKGNIHWGITIEAILTNGTTMFIPIFFCASKGAYSTQYSINTNNSGWSKSYEVYPKMMFSIEKNAKGRLDIYGGMGSTSLASINHSVVGIRSIQFHLGCAAKIEVQDLKFMSKKTQPSTSVQQSQNTNNKIDDLGVQYYNRSKDHLGEKTMDKAIMYMEMAINHGITLDLIKNMLKVSFAEMLKNQREQQALENVLYTTILLEKSNPTISEKQNFYFIRGLSKMLLGDASCEKDLAQGGEDGKNVLKEIEQATNQEINKTLRFKGLIKDPNFKIK